MNTDINAAPHAADAGLARRTTAKVAWRLAPFSASLYVLAYLDRVNVGFAALTMNADLHLSATAYGAAAGIFFFTYVLFGVPSNILLAQFGARRWIAFITITWGVIAAATALAQDFYSLSALRLLLGVAEAGLLPGILFYLSQWLPAAQRTRIMSGFFIALPVAFIFGGPISTALLSLDWFGMRGWQWMFVLEGLVTCCAGVAVLALLTDRPESAKWLRDDERAWLIGTLKAEHAARGGAKATALRHGLLNARVWLLGTMYACILAASGCYGFWLPLIIKSIGGLTNFEIGLLITVPYFVAIFAIPLWGRHAAAKQELTWHICIPTVLAAIGFAFAAWVRDPWLMTGLLFATVVLVYMTPPLVWEMATRSMTGPAAAVGIALINSIASTSGYFGPQIMGYLKDVTGSFAPGLLVLSALLLAATALAFWLGRSVEIRHLAPAE